MAEVVSPSMESTDRREILGPKAYLILEQERARVERHFRDEEGVWFRADLVDEGGLSVPCPETSLTLAEIYEGLQDRVPGGI